MNGKTSPTELGITTQPTLVSLGAQQGFYITYVVLGTPGQVLE